MATVPGPLKLGGQLVDDERLAEVQAELVGLAAGQRRLEAALAALPSAVAAAVTGQDPSESDGGLVRKASLDIYENEMIESQPSTARSDAGCASMTGRHSRLSHSRSRLDTWPATLVLREDLTARTARRTFGKLDAERFAFKELPQDEKEKKEKAAVEKFIVKQVSRCPVLDPDSLVLIPHKVALIIALVHDLIIQPYVLAWDMPFSGEVMHTAEIAIGFWWIDLMLNFVIGFYKDGDLERRPKVIGKCYLKSWFLPDFFGVLGDAISLAPHVREFLGRRFALRCIGILRIHKLAAMFDTVLEQGLSENWRMAWKGVRLALFLFWLNHIICCSWYSIGMNAPADTGGRWLDELGDTDGDEHEFYRYITAFHWAMGQIAAGGIENISAFNSIERCFSIFILVFGVFTFSIIVSSLSSAMLQMQLMYQEQTEKMRNLRLFLSQNHVHQKMALRVQKQVAERMRRRKRITEKDVSALQLLSGKLRAELRFDITGRHLLRLPLLRVCSQLDESVVRTSCGEAIDVICLSRSDNLFVADAAANGCYFLLEGRQCYTVSANSMFVDDERTHEVHPGTWISEAALWTKWKHVGTMDAIDGCEVLSVAASRLLTGLLHHEVIGAVVSEYAKQFHRRVTAACPPRAAWPTDLHVPFTEYAELVLSMDAGIQGIVGAATLSNLRHRHKMDNQGFAELVEEVKAGKCAVMMNSNGDMERAVSLTALHVELEDTDVLVHLGKIKGTRLNPQCQLPGTKQERMQTPNEATEKLLHRLHYLVGKARFTKTEQAVEWRESPTYGMPTRYFRAVHYATVERPPNRPAQAIPRKDGSSARGGVPCIYAVCHHEELDGYDFYTWLPRERFDSLQQSGSAGKQEVRGWLEALDMDALQHMRPAMSSRSGRSGKCDTPQQMRRSTTKDEEEGRLLVQDGSLITSDSVACLAPETPHRPAKWEVEDWTVPVLPCPELPPSNRLGGSELVSSSGATSGTSTAAADSLRLSPRVAMARSAASSGADFAHPALGAPLRGSGGYKRFSARGKEL